MSAVRETKLPIGLLFAGAFLLVLVALAVVLPIISPSRINSTRSLGLNRVKKLSMGILIYANDHDGTLPLAANWTESARAGIGNDAFVKDLFLSPGAVATPGPHFAFRKRLAAVPLAEIENPAATALLFDSVAVGRNPVGELDSLPTPGRYVFQGERGNLVAFVDPTARWVADSDHRSLR